MKRLFKTKSDKKISGVCGGIGIYLGIDPSIIRILFIILSFLGSFKIMILIYIIMAFIMPKETDIINK